MLRINSASANAIGSPAISGDMCQQRQLYSLKRTALAVTIATLSYRKIDLKFGFHNYSTSLVQLIHSNQCIGQCRYLISHRILVALSEKRKYHSVWLQEMGNSCTRVFSQTLLRGNSNNEKDKERKVEMREHGNK